MKDPRLTFKALLYLWKKAQTELVINEKSNTKDENKLILNKFFVIFLLELRLPETAQPLSSQRKTKDAKHLSTMGRHTYL